MTPFRQPCILAFTSFAAGLWGAGVWRLPFMKTLILYGSPTKLTIFSKLVQRNPDYYVRVEKSNLDYEEALTEARPRDGETVLNTVEV